MWKYVDSRIEPALEDLASRDGVHLEHLGEVLVQQTLALRDDFGVGG